MIKYGGTPRLVLLFAILFLCASLTQSAFAMPSAQIAACGPGTDCYTPLNPEPDEYYAITCNNNTITVWVTMPVPALVSLIPLFQVIYLGDGEELTVPNGLTLTIDGDTITISGSNGNRAPEPGMKSFSWNECVARNGGLPEIPGLESTPTNEQAACLALQDETAITACLVNLPETCEDFVYSISHQEECGIDNCENTLYAANHLEECTNEDSSYEILFAIVNACFNPVGAGAAVVSFAAFSSRRKRK